nr:IS66 family transposase zinc-finger binding domain-containing protein [Mesorhizobium sp. WSM3866]
MDRFNRKAFGRSSEKLGQMLLELEDLETDVAAGMPDAELPIVANTDKVRVLPVRKLNPNLPRKRIVREPSCACCPGCGGDLRAMGADHEEMLDLVAQAWQVIETVRPKYSCRTCDKIIQAPAPAKAIARGKLSYAALAHIMMAKWGYHPPFALLPSGTDDDRQGRRYRAIHPCAQRRLRRRLARSDLQPHP